VAAGDRPSPDCCARTRLTTGCGRVPDGCDRMTSRAADRQRAETGDDIDAELSDDEIYRAGRGCGPCVESHRRGRPQIDSYTGTDAKPSSWGPNCLLALSITARRLLSGTGARPELLDPQPAEMSPTTAATTAIASLRTGSRTPMCPHVATVASGRSARNRADGQDLDAGEPCVLA